MANRRKSCPMNPGRATRLISRCVVRGFASTARRCRRIRGRWISGARWAGRASNWPGNAAKSYGIDFSRGSSMQRTVLKKSGELEFDGWRKGSAYPRRCEGARGIPTARGFRLKPATPWICGRPRSIRYRARRQSALPAPRSRKISLPPSRILVKPGGRLVFTTPCTWLEEFTPRRTGSATKTPPRSTASTAISTRIFPSSEPRSAVSYPRTRPEIPVDCRAGKRLDPALR